MNCDNEDIVLLQRCFFQDVKKDEFGEVESFKMHDLAQIVSGNETRVILDSRVPNVDSSIRHLFDARYKVNDAVFIKSKIRSYLLLELHEVGGNEPFPMGEIINNFACLRALALNHLKVPVLPDTMGSLLHLRYLNLAHNDHITELPNSIAKLYNLRILNLSNCRQLRKWPKDFNKLVNLTQLYINHCNTLLRMPAGIGKLNRLRVLTDFLVCDERASPMKQYVAQLEDLKALVVNLQGQIVVRFYDNFSKVRGYNWGGNCLKGGEYLKKIKLSFFEFYTEQNENDRRIIDEVLMKNLQPHSGLKKFEMEFYRGETISRWGRAQDNWAIVLPNLVYIELRDCKQLRQLPLLSKLLYLKSLHLNGLEKLEYVEDDIKSEHVAEECDCTFFPSLESLEIRGLDSLKGWFKSGSSSNIHDKTVFRYLTQLSIIECPDLTSFPPCPNLQILNLEANNEALRITLGNFIRHLYLIMPTDRV